MIVASDFWQNDVTANAHSLDCTLQLSIKLILKIDISAMRSWVYIYIYII